MRLKLATPFRIAVLAVVLLAAAVIGAQVRALREPAGAALDAPHASPSAPASVSPETRWYAEANGVSLAEAARRLELQPAIGQLNAALESQEASTFAGLWIEHAPRYRVVAGFTRDGESTIARYVAAGSPLAKIVEVSRAQFTLTRLQEDIDSVTSKLQGLPFTASVNMRENRIDVQVGGREEVDAFLRARAIQLPQTARLVYMAQGASLDCGDESGRAVGVFFPRHCTQPWQPMMAALIEGALTLRDGCLLVGNDLAIWPPGWTVVTAADRLEVRDANGAHAGAVGERARYGGGQLSDPKQIANVIGREPPSECRGLKAWVVGSIVRP